MVRLTDVQHRPTIPLPIIATLPFDMLSKNEVIEIDVSNTGDKYDEIKLYPALLV
jgi:hypothetical protein